MTIGLDAVRAALLEACPGLGVGDIRPLDAGYTSRQWVADTDEGPLLAKTPIRNPDPAHLRRLIAATRRAADGGVPVVRFRALLPHSADVGGPLLVQEYQDGTPADGAWSTMDAAARLAFATDLGTVVGQIHACTGPWFGDVLGRSQRPDARTFLHTRVGEQLSRAPGVLSPELIDRAGAALHRAIDDVPPDAPPSLVHGDLWRPNLLLRAGRITCVLDFEHGRWADRFLDFGKLDEHIFATWPEGREAFLTAYDAVLPLPDDWQTRVRLGNAIHALSTAVYFARWNPEFVPEYVASLSAWLDGEES
ncbi:aminoglycoside phosphotransferase family protein [Dactylosporangium sp. NPDC000244]|uniref:phosphotransferase family protein n=1 Tax=Dactylosporangium sp. NPDC000244 TaxID=3154365 RepID=UPI003331A2E5